MILLYFLQHFAYVVNFTTLFSELDYLVNFTTVGYNQT